MTALVIFAAIGYKALLLVYLWLGSAIVASILSKSKGYGEKPGLGTGLLLTVLGPIIWLFVPPKDETAEWHVRKPWQRRHKPREAEMAGAAAGAGGRTAIAARGGDQANPDAGGLSPADESGGAGSRPGESRGR